MALRTIKTMTNTSPSSATTTVGAQTISGLTTFDWFDITADLQGATGGTLDVYIQRKEESNRWVDWIHFAQLAAADPAVKYCVPGEGTIGAITTIGGGTDAAPGVALAVNVACGGHPGDELRMVFVAGAGTTAGAAQTLRLQCHKLS